MNFVVSSHILPKKCLGLYTKVVRQENVCYLKFNDDFEVEFVIKRNESDSGVERWEMVEKANKKIRAFHLDSDSPEDLTSTWTILVGKTTRKGVIKFVSEDLGSRRGKKRGFNDRNKDGKKNVKRAFGRKVSQECKPIATKHVGATKKRLEVLEDPKPQKLECDIATQNDELYSTSYVHEIMSHIRSVELQHLPKRDYIKKIQVNITEKNRRTLLNWMNLVVTKYRQKNSTYHLAVNLFDRFLSTEQVSKNSLQLVGSVCLWLAAKYMEVTVPSMEDFVILSDDLFDSEEMCDMECKIVNALDFEFTIPTPLTFAERFGHVIKYMLNLDKQKRRLMPLINYFLEHCSLVYEFVGQPPSLIAASASYAAAVWLDKEFEWNEDLEREVGYTVQEMSRVVNTIKYQIYEKKRDPAEPRSHVFEKYKTRKHEHVALMRYAKQSRVA